MNSSRVTTSCLPQAAALENSKIVDWQRLRLVRGQWRDEGKTVVWTNGCFDILHSGHVRSLAAARALGDVLVVGLNSDESVRRIKGPSRPVIPQADRAEILAALEAVTAVVIFDELTPEAALAAFQPDIHCKGEDYAPPHGKPIPEANLVQSYGGRIEFIPLFANRSTSNIVERIRSLPDSNFIPNKPR
jgi:rfaE bifunctional protein nucleotidyltransferase chain/domain